MTPNGKQVARKRDGAHISLTFIWICVVCLCVLSVCLSVCRYSEKEQTQLVTDLIKRFDEMQEKDLALVEEEYLDLERQELSDLRMRHDDEIVQGYFRCAPDEMLEKYQKEAAAKRTAEIKDFKRTINVRSKNKKNLFQNTLCPLPVVLLLGLSAAADAAGAV